MIYRFNISQGFQVFYLNEELNTHFINVLSQADDNKFSSFLIAYTKSLCVGFYGDVYSGDNYQQYKSSNMLLIQFCLEKVVSLYKEKRRKSY